MAKKLLALNGFAIIAVVLNHVGWFGQFSMFLWTDRYLPVSVPNWNQVGSITYYIIQLIRQPGMFSVPAFIFSAGYFISYTSLGSQNRNIWKVVANRLKWLIIPYLIWSAVVFIGQYLAGTTHTFLEYFIITISKGAEGPYYFVPLISYLYLLSPIITAFVKKHLKIALISSAIIQLAAILYFYLDLFHIYFPGFNEIWYIVKTYLPPLWIFYFTLGIAVALNLDRFKKWLNRNKKLILIGLILFSIMNHIEVDITLRLTKDRWGSEPYTLSLHLFALFFILFFLTLEKIPFSSYIYKLGGITYGIYLLHFTIIDRTAKIIYYFIPRFLSHQVLFMVLLFAVGFFIPIIMMKIFSRPPLRAVYRYSFG